MDKPEIVITLERQADIDQLVLSLKREGYKVQIRKLSEEAHISAFPEGCLIVTDSRRLAREQGRLGRPVIGLETSEDSGKGDFFLGTEYVLTSLEASQAFYIDQVYRRLKGIPFQIAETGRISIRESTEDDFEAFYLMEHGEKDQGRIFGQKLSEDRELAKSKYLAYIHTAYRFYGFGLWTVLERKSCRVIGRCGLSPQADDASPEGRIELGYLIKPAERNKGYGLEACAAILNFAFQDLQCQEIYARISEKNCPSRALARRMGFEKNRNMGDGTWLWKLTDLQFQDASGRRDF